MNKLTKRKQQLLEVSNTCINCDAPLALDQRYCPGCGGKRMYNRITWRNLLEDFADRFLNIENAFFKTFIALFKKPDDVIGGYMLGMRKKYLTASSYFAVALTVAGLYNFVLRKWFFANYVEAQTSLYSGQQAEFQKAFATSFSEVFLEYQSLFMFLSIPFMAILSRIVFWNYKKYNLVEHFVIYLYAYSHFSLISISVNAIFIWNVTLLQILSFAVLLGMFVYMGYVLKRLFDLDVGSLILKSGLFALIFFGLLISTFMGVGIYYGVKIARGGEVNSDFERMIKAEFEKGRRAKMVQDSVAKTKDSIRKDEKTFVLDTLSQ